MISGFLKWPFFNEKGGFVRFEENDFGRKKKILRSVLSVMTRLFFINDCFHYISAQKLYRRYEATVI